MARQEATAQQPSLVPRSRRARSAAAPAPRGCAARTRSQPPPSPPQVLLLLILHPGPTNKARTTTPKRKAPGKTPPLQNGRKTEANSANFFKKIKQKRAEKRRRKKENVLPHLRSQARRAPRGNVERLFAERGAGGKKEGKKKNQQTLFLSLRDSAKASLPSAVSWEAPGPGLLNSSSRLPPPPSAAQFPPAFGASSRHGPEPPALLHRSRLDLLHLAVAAVGNEGEEIPNE